MGEMLGSEIEGEGSVLLYMTEAEYRWQRHRLPIIANRIIFGEGKGVQAYH